MKDELNLKNKMVQILIAWEVDALEQISEQDREQLKFASARSGLELMNDRRAELIGEIKKSNIEMSYHVMGKTKSAYQNI